VLLYRHVRRPKTHWLRSDGSVGCGGASSGHVSTDPVEITCKRCIAKREAAIRAQETK
jgi:hypothetical protein